MIASTRLFAVLVLLCGCDGIISDPPGAADRGQDFVDPSATTPIVNGRLEARIWRLSSAQFENEVALLLGADVPAITIPAGADEEGFSGVARNAGVDVGNVGTVDSVIRELSAWASEHGEQVTRCPAYGTPACVDEFLAWFLPAAYRRPATADETAPLRRMFDAVESEHGYDYALGAIVRAVLMSASFLYRTEVGARGESGRVVLTNHEIASALAFSLTEHGPDEELLAAADAGRLVEPDERERQARRLMEESGPLWTRLFREWLGMTRLSSAAEGSGVPEALVEQMEEEYETFVEEVVVQQRGSLHDLLGATYTWAQPELAELYGAEHSGEGLQRIELDPTQRAGLFTGAAWLTSHATVRDDYVVRRGMGIFVDALCKDLEPPNIDVEEANAQLAGPDATVREVVEARGAAPVCGGCHAVPDPVGLAFEAYDNTGRFRTRYADGDLVDSQVSIPGVGDFDNAADVSRALAGHEEFQQCFVRRFVQVFVGHDLGSPVELEWTREAYETFRSLNTSIWELVVALVRHRAFVEREKEPG